MLLALIGTVIGLLCDTTTYLRKQIIHGNPYHVVGTWIANNRDEFPPSKKPILPKNYYIGVLPVLVSNDSYYSYWAMTDYIRTAKMPYSELLTYMKKHNLSVVMRDKKFIENRCPDFDSNFKKDFIVVKDFKNLNIRILRLKPE